MELVHLCMMTLPMVQKSQNTHLGCTKPCKQWDKLSIKWCRISSINSITTLAQPPHFENNIFWEYCQVGLLRTWNGKKKESSRHPVCRGHFLRSMTCPFKKKGGICYFVSYLVSEFVSSPRGHNIFGFRIGCCCSTLKFLASDVTKLSLFDVTVAFLGAPGCHERKQ